MSLEGNVVNMETLPNLKGKVTYVPKVDETLTKKGYSADAKATGDALKELNKSVGDIKEPTATTVKYDNTASTLVADTIQGAIDELATNSFDKNKGGVVNGVVSVKTADNGYGTVSKNHSATADYGTQLIDVRKDGKSSKVSISSAIGTFTYTDVDGNIHDILHEGNKPFGSYTGNGTETERVIDTKGIGRMLLVYNTESFAFVTPEGALVIKATDGSISWVGGSKVFFINGKLTLLTTSDTLNKSDTTYHYQVI